MESAIILAGGSSSRFGVDKPFFRFKGKLLIQWVIDSVSGVVDEIVIASDKRRDIEGVQLAIDPVKGFGPVAGILAGLEVTQAPYSIVLGCDMPFVNERAVKLLFDLAKGHEAVIPKWENGYIEPLHAVYEKDAMTRATTEAINRNRRAVSYAISRLNKVNYVPIEQIKQIDQDLKTFVNVNRPNHR